jgi:ABC-type dipeptide/oligopeptide/nickel transport system permease subunit
MRDRGWPSARWTLSRTASRLLDILFAFPGVLLAILAIALFGAGLPAAVIALALAHKEGHPQQALFAGILIVITVCAFTILGERMTDTERSLVTV